ncbi:MAG TPA: SRPBCC family protein, partial [Solirubrobacterales bacterium]|nr:SRPBCC family protein [Solirubrobacterales bacterium]
MAQVEANTEVDASLAEAWDLYFDASRWPAWVDGFGSVASSAGYPEGGGTLVWRSTPAGRGTVHERVAEHEPRRLHRIEFSDPEASGTLETSFEMLPGTEDAEHRTLVTQVLDYRLAQTGPLRALTDVLFI